VRSVWREIQLLRGFDHPNIVRFIAAHHGPTHILLIMEHAGTSNMKRMIADSGGRLKRNRARAFIGQLFSALACTHARGVAHRDIKPENIAITVDGVTLKLLDFGSAAPFSKPCTDMAGTMPFMAPEILSAADKDPYIPSGCDMWATAVALLEMLCGFGKLNKMLNWGPRPKPSPQRSEELRIFFKDFNAVYAALKEDLGAVESSMMDLLVGMLQIDYRARCSAQEAVSCEWLVGRESRTRTSDDSGGLGEAHVQR